MTKFTVIDDTKEARDKHGHMWGSVLVILTEADMILLRQGKCLAFDDGEYQHFLVVRQ